MTDTQTAHQVFVALALTWTAGVCIWGLWVSKP